MLTPVVTEIRTLDPTHGTGQTITLSQETLAWEQDVYENDPTGGNPSAY